MSREQLADLVNTMLLKLSGISERHDVPFEDMLVKLPHVARHDS
jgi:hypothetical protein